MRNLVKILIIIIVIVIIIFGILLLAKTKDVDKENGQIEKNEKIIIRNEFIDSEKDNGYIYYIYADGEIQKEENNKKTKIKNLSKEETNHLIELIDNVDETKYTEILTFAPVTSGYETKIYNSRNEEIVIKDFYKTNTSNAAIEIFEILEESKLY